MPDDWSICSELRVLLRELDRTRAWSTETPCPLPPGGLQLYASSWRRAGGGFVFMARSPVEKLFVTVDASLPMTGDTVSIDGHQVGLHRLTPDNAAVLREVFPFTAPARLRPGLPSFGCGDRLGSANPGHLRALKDYRVIPVLAQQSTRELGLTGRTFAQVIDAASWAVFQEGYEDGFGADGDHLKSLDEVAQALAAGVSMVTLDLSLFLNSPGGAGPCPGELAALAGQSISCGGWEAEPTAEEIERFWRIYGAGLEFAARADDRCRAVLGADRYDLEISVDETMETTRPLDHLLLALELRRRGIRAFSVAPRFPGEFQKAVDYRGDLAVFAREFGIHAAIAAYSGHKVSIHSGSDKFAIFPHVGRLAGGNFHEKTAGTSWLEALRVAALKAPALFRRIYAKAAASFPAAKQYYHVETQPADITSIDGIPDAHLPAILEQDRARQALHITYGQILRDPGLGPELGRLLYAEEAAYYEILRAHFQRHADALGIERR